LPIFHSTDLVSWRQIGNAIDRPDQINYGENEELSRGRFAATIDLIGAEGGLLLFYNTKPSSASFRSG
jgi:beta-xylosidase